MPFGGGQVGKGKPLVIDENWVYKDRVYSAILGSSMPLDKVRGYGTSNPKGMGAVT